MVNFVLEPTMTDFQFAVVVVFFTVIYILLGVGVTRAVAKIKDREINLVEIFLWPMVLVAIAATGDTN